ncbi:MutS domain V protein [Ancylostoma caninum]|uniref:DNA mismatch repair protein n=1 Tax=Ancylostoma caninum TaxID=29170 RepID=A0A368FQG2_ANCCA|nr:MutS domain V protein [Ancylostoma caninum]
MSAKRQSSLFSFFTPKSGTASLNSTTPKSSTVRNPVKRELFTDDDADEESRTLKRVNNEEESPVARNKESVKRRRIIVSSDEEDNTDENLLANNTSTPISAAPNVSTPKTARGLRPLKECSTPLSTAQAESFIDSFRINEDDLNMSAASIDTLDRTIYQIDPGSSKLKSQDKVAMVEDEKFTHETLSFLKPEKIRDAQGRRPDEDGYDPTTLFVPADFLKDQTPVGKFYELYHMDAVIAVECLGLTFMRGSYAHAGFPEPAYGKFADQLVSRGYKVARIEQTETPQQLEERNRKANESRTLKRVNNEEESPVARNKESVKRRRIIVSSDEEDNTDENLLANNTSTPISAAPNVSTPKNARGLRPLKECSTPLSTAQAESFIDSFRMNEDDLPAYGKFADQLVSRGYKVARIEQTETPQQLEERNRKANGGKENVVRREVCRVTTSGTRTYAVLDGCNLYGGETDNGETQSKYLLSIKEQVEDHVSTYGICFVDTSVGKFFLGEFRDDDYSSCLRTLIANFTPVQVLFERGHLSSHCKAILNGTLNSVQKEGLAPKRQFFDADETIKLLSNDKYFGSDHLTWPDTLRNMLVPDSVVAKPSLDSMLALSALGAVLYYLQRCLIDVDMVTMRDFTMLEPLGENSKAKITEQQAWANRQMVLDGITLENLNLVPGDNRDAQAASLSLYSTVNKCQTPFGKRLLRQWICAPTCDVNVLKARQEAVEWFMSPAAARFVEKLTELFRKIPDLERLLQKIHTLGLKYRAESHPDSRAVMFEAANYNKRKIRDLLNTLTGFQTCHDLIVLYDKHRQDHEGCPLMDQCIGVDNKIDLYSHLEHFTESFNHSVAEKEGIIVPQKGQDEEYDRACQSVTEAMRQLEVYRKEQENKLRCKITYFGSGKNRFQMEIPESVNPPRSYELKSRRKGFGRYTTEELDELIENVFKAEAYKDQQRDDATRRVFSDFDSRRSIWSAVLDRVAQVDVLLSLARYCQTCGLAVCRPEFVYNSEKPFLVIEEGYHPCLAVSLPTNEAASACTYIANDSHLGGDHPPTVLLTGPNMGGKSTLMRQVAVLTVLAHMGSLVPARSMRLSPVDRIFTRIGANDRLICGQSTFFVELKETLIILRNATKHSLVLIDELGRGTSTFDGTAIASAVLSELSRRVQCRSFFSTHYHSLCRAASVNPNITLAHMTKLAILTQACMVENENEDDPTEESVTFLYRLTAGVCPKSYGFYAARLAGVRPEVVKEAYDASSLLFDSVNRKKMAIAGVKAAARAGGSVEQLREMIRSL